MSRKISVYDLSGNFKRSFGHKEGSNYVMEIYSFDSETLICRDDSYGREGMLENPNIFLLISKQDGSVRKEIEIPYKEKISSIVLGDGYVMPIRNRRLVPQHDNSYTLVETSADTIYRLLPDYSLVPLIERKPSVQSMSPPVFLFPSVITDRYVFMQTVKNEWLWEANTGHTRINLMYDKEEKAIYEYILHNADVEGGQPITMTSEFAIKNDEITFVLKLEVEDILEDYSKGRLKGRLKEIAEKLDEDANPVFMVVKYRR